MTTAGTSELVHTLRHGDVTRRDFIARGIGAGMSLGAIGAALRAHGASAAQDAERSRTVIFDIDAGRSQSPTLWNPLVPGFRGDAGYNQALMEPLFILNYETGEVEPWLGETFAPNETLDVWTLKLREGITWSDGEAFDADDVVFTIQLLVDGPLELANAASMQEWVAGVEKVDALTVQFTLTDVNPRFQLDYFSVRVAGSLPILPEHIWRGQDPLTFENYDEGMGWPVFTGPYTLASVSATEFVYERDPEWWGAATGFLPLPQPERLVWVANETEEIKAARAANHELDSVMDMTLGAFEALKAQNPDMIAWVADLPYSWLDPCARLLSLNHTVAPWGEPAMRQAVSYAIDRDVVVVIAYEGSTTPARYFFPAYPPLEELVGLLDERGLYDQHPVFQTNPDMARQLIEEAGYTMGDDGYYARDGEQLRLLISTHESFIELQRVAQVVVEQLQEIGINATTRSLAGATWDVNKAQGEYEAVVDWDACGSVNEPWLSMDRYTAQWLTPVGERTPGNNNHIRWESDAYSQPVTEMATLPLGDPQVSELFVQASEIWLQELPFLPVTQAKKLVPFDTYYWTGWPSQENNYLHPPTWWNSAHKIIHNLQPTGN
ncbi:MAG: ABC transporter substrate-binding protein [Chloroflexia bacterium]|nr:ABC transporter substrate-binding protein [Chloroflexia bacterium]